MDAVFFYQFSGTNRGIKAIAVEYEKNGQFKKVGGKTRVVSLHGQILFLQI